MYICRVTARYSPVSNSVGASQGRYVPRNLYPGRPPTGSITRQGHPGVFIPFPKRTSARPRPPAHMYDHRLPGASCEQAPSSPPNDPHPSLWLILTWNMAAGSSQIACASVLNERLLRARSLTVPLGFDPVRPVGFCVAATSPAWHRMYCTLSGSIGRRDVVNYCMAVRCVARTVTASLC